jgi:hypothetical protein
MDTLTQVTMWSHTVKAKSNSLSKRDAASNIPASQQGALGCSSLSGSGELPVSRKDAYWLKVD